MISTAILRTAAKTYGRFNSLFSVALDTLIAGKFSAQTPEQERSWHSGQRNVAA